MPRLLPLVACLFLSAPLFAQTREEKVRSDKQKVEAAGFWIYGDLDKAYSEAEKTARPIIAVLRCLPCVECVKLDDDLIEADPAVKKLLEKFVRVRIVSTNGLDLSLFQFDTDQSFAVFFLTPDGAILGRYGTRSHRKEWETDVSIAGLAQAMTGALELFADYPKNKAALALKRGPKPEFARPELFPTLSVRYTARLDYQGNVVQSCIHCHQIGDALRDRAFTQKNVTPELLFPYPHPKTVGLILDPAQRATVREVTPDSPAAKAGFQKGDVIRTLGGQPLLSIADVQWVLNGGVSRGAEFSAVVARGDKEVSLSLRLPEHWREQEDLAWRASTWNLRRRALGGIFAVELTAAERAEIKLPDQKLLLRVEHVGQYAPHNLAHQAGVRKGDLILGFDGRTDFTRETDLIRHALFEKKPGDKLSLDLLRDGKKQTVFFTLP